MPKRYLWCVWLLISFFFVSVVNEKYSDRLNLYALDVSGIIIKDTIYTFTDSPVNVTSTVNC